jgi:hypothetical protein
MLVDGQPSLPRDNTHEDDHLMHHIGMSSEEGNSDGTLILSPSPSPSPSKRKFSAIGNEVSYVQPGAALLISLPASTSSLSLPASNLLLSLPASNSLLSLPLSSGHKSLKMGKLSASKNVITALDAGFDQMGETLQQFMDVIKKLFLPQETHAATQHDKAVELVQEHNDGLMFDERITFITYLTNNPTAVCTYLALKDNKYREGWVQSIVRRDA